MTSPTAVRADILNLVALVSKAIKDDRVTGLAGVLAKLEASGAFNEGDLFAPVRSDRYSRRLIWLDPAQRFVVVGMTWAPGQGSPLHDHAGLWGAEVVVQGVMRQITYHLEERDAAGRYRFTPVADARSGRGEVGVLIPPLEYHDFGNGGSDVARTVHVYGGNLARCQAFTDDGDGWWSARQIELRYDG